MAACRSPNDDAGEERWSGLYETLPGSRTCLESHASSFRSRRARHANTTKLRRIPASNKLLCAPGGSHARRIITALKARPFSRTADAGSRDAPCGPRADRGARSPCPEAQPFTAARCPSASRASPTGCVRRGRTRQPCRPTSRRAESPGRRVACAYPAVRAFWRARRAGG